MNANAARLQERSPQNEPQSNVFQPIWLCVGQLELFCNNLGKLMQWLCVVKLSLWDQNILTVCIVELFSLSNFAGHHHSATVVPSGTVHPIPIPIA